MMAGRTSTFSAIWVCSTLILSSFNLDTALAGCKKRRATNVLPHEWSLNVDKYEIEAMPQESLPTNFSWLDVDGVNMLAPSWNQHVSFCMKNVTFFTRRK